MEHNEDLARLEQFVEKLLASHNQLKSENKEMQAQLQAKQQEISELQETLKSLQEDRSVMHDRVSGLIDRIDEWEKNFDLEETGPDKAPEEGGSQSMSQKSSSLFNVSAERSSESAAR
ncbi:MAG: cell division protein ZapB [Desulfobulbales bacterium]